MDAEERAALIEKYREGYDEVVAALADVREGELDAPAPDGWTARQVVHHLADRETTSYVRLRRLIAEERPVIQGYDEEEFARRLYYDRPVEASLEVLKAVRRASAELLERLTEEEWRREGMHSESGRYGVEDWLRIYAVHAHEHAEQIRRARRGAGA